VDVPAYTGLAGLGVAATEEAVTTGEIFSACRPELNSPVNHVAKRRGDSQPTSDLSGRWWTAPIVPGILKEQGRKP